MKTDWITDVCFSYIVEVADIIYKNNLQKSIYNIYVYMI